MSPRREGRLGTAAKAQVAWNNLVTLHGPDDPAPASLAPYMSWCRQRVIPQARIGCLNTMGLLGIILIIILVLLLLGAIPAGRRNRRAGWGLGGVAGTILIIVLILLLFGVL